MIVGVLGQAILAVLGYLVPMAFAGSADARASARARLAVLPRLRPIALNVGVALAVGAAAVGADGRISDATARSGWLLIGGAVSLGMVLLALAALGGSLAQRAHRPYGSRPPGPPDPRGRAAGWSAQVTAPSCRADDREKSAVLQRVDRVWMALAMSLAIFLALTIGLTFDSRAGTAVLPAAPGVGTVAGLVADPVGVTLAEFSISPGDVSITAGMPVTIEVTNTGVTEHDLTVEGVAGTEAIAAGTSAILELQALDPGSYTLLCTISGHREAGMEATLTVADEGAVSADRASPPVSSAMPMSPEDMAAMHDAGVAAFPQETVGSGNQPMEPDVLADGTLLFELTADEIEWETKPGVVKQGMAYNSQIPGPQLHADLGDTVRIVLHNELAEPTALHSHGLILPNAMDGVPGLTQPAVLPGESFTYEFVLRNSGSHMYHSHFNSAVQVTSGLLGAFIVADPADPVVDQDYVMIANDGPLGFTLNGKDFPATEPIVAQHGDLLRIRYMNEGLQIHPMHLHGLPQQVIAKDGYALPQPHFEDTVLVGPGERVDVLVDATELGAWALHCHILTHAEGPEGMFGMVTALIVEG